MIEYEEILTVTGQHRPRRFLNHSGRYHGLAQNQRNLHFASGSAAQGQAVARTRAQRVALTSLRAPHNVPISTGGDEQGQAAESARWLFFVADERVNKRDDACSRV